MLAAQRIPRAPRRTNRVHFAGAALVALLAAGRVSAAPPANEIDPDPTKTAAPKPVDDKHPAHARAPGAGLTDEPLYAGDLMPPPPPTRALDVESARCQCPPETDPNPIAWGLAGLAALGLVFTGSWGAVQHRRARVIREELSRIRMHRTAAIRVSQPLKDGKMPPAPGTPRMPPNPATELPEPGKSAPVAGGTGAAAIDSGPVLSEPERSARLKQQSEASLAAAQAGLDALLEVVRSVEDYFRSPDFEAVLAAAGSSRTFFERHRRRAVAATATFHALRDARIYPESEGNISAELERYWEQVYECVDDLYRIVEDLGSDEGRRALAGAPAAEGLRPQHDRLLLAARDYLATDGRRLIQIDLFRTDVDPRLHQAIDKKKLTGVPSGKIIGVARCGITRDGRVVRPPQVVQSV